MKSYARKPLALLAIAACITLLTAAAFMLISHSEWSWLSNLLGAVLFGLLVISVRLLLDALESWVAPPSQGRERS